VLFTFPSWYWFTLGRQVYLALGSGLPSFRQDFPCPAVLRIPTHIAFVSPTGLSPALASLSSAVRLPDDACCRSFNPVATEVTTVWAAPLSLATTHGILSFPPGTWMFQFPEFPAHELSIHSWLRWHSPAWVSPFGHRRLTALAQLPVAYRSATRPSSAFDA
jgi:hypothetical protein